jgi:hypothetical protein
MHGAWLAYTRQELYSPALFLRECSQGLYDDVRELGPEDFESDVSKILQRSDQLLTRVQQLLEISPTEGEAPTDLAKFQQTVRHDLRSPASFVISACEMLEEEAWRSTCRTWNGSSRPPAG